MKVLLINGSSRTNGNTALALDLAGKVLSEQGIETDKIDIGTKALHGCIGCGGCARKQNRTCASFDDDPVNGWIQTMLQADGFIIGSPVYYSGINGALKSFLDRAFFVASVNGALFRHKVGAAICAVRRAGSLPAIEQINKYFSISEMFMPSGNYWPMIFGLDKGEAEGDGEGRGTVECLSANMAWLLKLIEHGRQAVPPPPTPQKVFTNFIR